MRKARRGERNLRHATQTIPRQTFLKPRGCRSSRHRHPPRDRRPHPRPHHRRHGRIATRLPGHPHDNAEHQLGQSRSLSPRRVHRPAHHSPRKFLMENLVRKTGIVNFHQIDGDDADPSAVAREVGEQLASAPIDVAFLGIGENGHIAFNDPPANFTTEEPYVLVDLDEPCRQQQVGEGWFSDLSQVPRRAISMSPRQILKATELVVVVPDQRKAHAVKLCLEGKISPTAPASILRTHPNATVYLDADSASLLSPALKSVLAKESQAVLGS